MALPTEADDALLGAGPVAADALERSAAKVAAPARGSVVRGVGRRWGWGSDGGDRAATLVVDSAETWPGRETPATAAPGRMDPGPARPLLAADDTGASWLLLL